MSHTIKQLPQSQVEITITIKPEDYQRDLEAAATRLSERAAITGFRPGKAPYNIVKQQLGEIKILEEAMQTIVEKNYFSVVTQEKLGVIGAPEITLEKMAPGNDFVFKAVATLLPKVTLADFKTIKIEKKRVEIGDKEIDATLENLKKMRGKEVIKSGPATTDDKAVVSMEMFLDNVPVEGGQAPNHQVYLNEPHYIPGFAEQLVGLKKDDTKEFVLKFPVEHYQKHLAGKDIGFKVKVKDVYSLEYPAIDDEFAKQLGQKSLLELRALLQTNLTHEAEDKENQRLETELLEKTVEQSVFGEIPEVLIKSEKHKMFHELKHDLEQRGVEMKQYLKDLKKTEEEIGNDFTERALTRAKAALISRQIALENNISVSQEEIDQEAEIIRSAYNNDPKINGSLKRHEVRDTLASTIQNRKVVLWLRDQILETK